MQNILDDDYTKKEIDLLSYNFRGKLAGKHWKREQAIVRISMARKVIFAMSLLVFYPILIQFLTFNTFDFLWFTERLVFAVILILCGFFYNKFRLVALIISLLPISLILFTYLFYIDYFPIRIIGFNIAIIVLILIGIYFHFQEIKLRRFLITEIRKENPEAVFKDLKVM